MKVCIVQPVMKGYRLPFFVLLAKRLARSGIHIEVVYGRPWKEEAKRGDHVDLPLPLGRSVYSKMLFGKLYFMATLKEWISSDLIIIEHANKHILNYFFSILWFFRIKRLAYWGHGRDRQSMPGSWGEKYKRGSLHWADWWFAYTKGASEYVESQKFPSKKITVVENAVDTRALREDCKSISDDERSEVLWSLGWGAENLIAVYCGSLYENKRFDLLFSACEKIHESIPNFRLIVIGAGPLVEDVRSFERSNSWVKYVGPKFGREKSVLFSISKLWLNPGLVGLGILDAFSSGLPFVTTDLPIHSPEIEYLEDGVNGLILDPSPEKLAQAVVGLLSDPVFLSVLRQGAIASGEKYSIETMVENFAIGVEKCLGKL